MVLAERVLELPIRVLVASSFAEIEREIIGLRVKIAVKNN